MEQDQPRKRVLIVSDDAETTGHVARAFGASREGRFDVVSLPLKSHGEFPAKANEADVVLIDCSTCEDVSAPLHWAASAGCAAPMIALVAEAGQEVSDIALRCGAVACVGRESWQGSSLERVVEDALEGYWGAPDFGDQSAFDFQKMVLALGTRFTSLDFDDVDTGIQSTLQAIGKVARADRGFVIQFRDNDEIADCTHEWCCDGIVPQASLFQNIATAPFQWGLGKVRRGEDLVILRVDDLPPEAQAEKDLLHLLDIRSAVLIPMVRSGRLVGMTGFASVRSERAWPPEIIALLRIGTRNFANAIERKREEKARRESEERYRAQFMAIPTPAFTWRKKDDHFELVSWNEAAELFTRGGVKKFVGVSDGQMLADRPGIRKNLLNCYNDRRIIKEEIAYPFRLTGEVRQLSVTYTFAPPDLVLVLSEDVTENRTALEALKASEDRFKGILDHSRDMAYKLDERTDNYEYISPSAVDILGYTDQEVIQMGAVGYERLIHPEDGAHIGAIYEAYRNDPSTHPIPPVLEYRVRHKDGNYRWVADSFSIISDQSGNALAEVGTLRDITVHKRAEDALRESEAKYRELVETANSVILRMDATGRVTFFNKYAQDFFGYSEAEIIGRNVIGTIVPETATNGSNLAVMIREIGRFTDEYAHNENENIRRNGERVWLAWTNKAILDSEGNVREILCIGNDITARKHAEEALTRSEEQYRLLAENISDVIWTMDLDERFTYISPSVHKALGYSVDEALRLSPKEITTPESYERAKQVLESAMAAGSGKEAIVDTVELEYIRKDGQVLFCEVRFSPLRDELGRILGVVGIARNIHSRKMAEKAVIESEERYRRITEAVTDYIYAVRVEKGRPVKTFHGPSCIAVTGYSNLDFDNRPELWIEMVYPADRNAVLEQAAEVLAGRIPQWIEHRIVRKDGAIRWVRNTPVPHRDAVGSLVSYDGLISDVTERRLAESALRESEEKYRNVVENAYDGICIIQEGRLAYVNSQFASMLGYTVAELVDTPFMRHVDPETTEQVFDICQGFLDNGSPPSVKECIMMRKTSESVEVELKASPIVYRGQHAQLVILRDVTERNRSHRLIAEQKLAMVATSRMSALGMMASGVAHEINNPLAIIGGSAEQVRELVGGNPESNRLFGKLIDRIIKHVDRIESIVKGLRTFSRDGSKDPFEQTSLKAIVEDALDLSAERFKAHGIGLIVPTIPDDLVVDCRPTQISQVLVNLLNNAHDAVMSLANKWVQIDIQDCVDSIELAVIDSGSGLPEEIRDKALQPFFTTKDVGKGIGLGLSISSGIIECHGGELMIDASSPNTRVVCRLPKRHASSPRG